MKAVTQWFSTKDNPPVRAGWYDVKYDADRHPNYMRYWWDLRAWRAKKNGGRTSFGNTEKFKDHWRGLAEKP